MRSGDFVGYTWRLMKQRSLVAVGTVLLVAFALAAFACGGDDTPPATPAATIPSPTASATLPSPTATEVPPSPTATATPEGFFVPDTPVAALLLDGYALRDGEAITYLTTDLPIIAGTGAAFWYQAMGRYVVVFDNVDLAVTGPLCPGASILTDDGFEHISNGPTAEGACDGAPTLAQSPAGAYLCAGVLVYVTEIPAGTEGTLYGTLELYVDGAIYGITSKTRGAAPTAAAINLTDCEPLP